MSTNESAPTGATATPEGETPPAAQPEGTESFTPIASQADLDRIVQARVARTEAKYADYDQLKAEWQANKDASTSDLDKAVARYEAAELATATSGRRALVLEAASKHGVPADYLNLITGDDADAIDAAAIQVGALASAAKPAADPAASGSVRFADPGQGGIPVVDENEIKEAFARQLFKID
jgi:septal ring factor EnvC (AmiA/AmiB activator)